MNPLLALLRWIVAEYEKNPAIKVVSVTAIPGLIAHIREAIELLAKQSDKPAFHWRIGFDVLTGNGRDTEFVSLLSGYLRAESEAAAEEQLELLYADALDHVGDEYETPDKDDLSVRIEPFYLVTEIACTEKMLANALHRAQDDEPLFAEERENAAFEDGCEWMGVASADFVEE